MHSDCLLTDYVIQSEYERLADRWGLKGRSVVHTHPFSARELSLDDYSKRYLEPVVVAAWVRENPGLDHPEWV